MGEGLDGRTAIVTGGASGIGEACARALAGAGARVTVIDLDGEAGSADEARSAVERMCEQLLANPLIESYEIEVRP